MSDKGLIKVKLIYPETYNYVDTIVDYKFIEENLYLLDSFNYPKLDIEKISEHTILHKNDNITVTFSISSFNKKQHNIEYYEDGFVRTIDGFKCYGNDGEIPKLLIESIKISISESTFSLPTDSIKNLFSPQLNQASTYVTEDNDLIIWLKNGDGAASYFVILFVNKRGQLIKKIIGTPF